MSNHLHFWKNIIIFAVPCDTPLSLRGGSYSWPFILNFYSVPEWLGHIQKLSYAPLLHMHAW
jgi:hypothetical protein